MKPSPRAALASALVFAFLAQADVARAAQDAGASTEWHQLQKQRDEEPVNPERMNQAEMMAWATQHNLATYTLAMAFYRNHPTDPRRWEAVLHAFESPPIRTNAQGQPDSAAMEADWAQGLKLLQALDASSDATPKAREGAALLRVNHKLGALYGDLPAGPVPAARWDEIQSDLSQLAKRFPSSREVAMAEESYLTLVSRHRPEAMMPLLAELASSPSKRIRGKIPGHQKVETARRTPLDLKFTALDGRAVDFTKLRGKVVLLDFWATWCGPCMAEMPNVKKAYDAYHAKGFEVIGVSCDYSPANADASHSLKDARTADQLKAFLAAHDMPWPQYYDGRKHNEGGNVLADRFSVSGIPAMFLLDKRGLLVTTDARGEQLHTEVKRLLASRTGG